MTIINLIGSKPNQVSLNRDLGNLAFQNKEGVTLGALTVADPVNIATSPGLVVHTDGTVYSGAYPSGVASGLGLAGVNIIGNNIYRNLKLIRVTDNASAPQILLTKTRGTSAAAPTIVTNGDSTGIIFFQGYDGSNAQNSATIYSEVDGTPGSGSMPGKLIFTTTPTGANIGTIRLTIDSVGRVIIAGDTLRISTAKTPASATATGAAGDICWDANYVYVCVATNTWKRSALTTW